MVYICRVDSMNERHLVRNITRTVFGVTLEVTPNISRRKLGARTGAGKLAIFPRWMGFHRRRYLSNHVPGWQVPL